MVVREELGTGGGVVFGIRWDGGKRPRRGWVAAALVVLLALAAPAAVHAAPVQPPVAPGLVSALVVPARGHGAQARRLVARLGGRAGRRIAVAGGFAARVPAGTLRRLRASHAVRAAAPDVRLSVRTDTDTGTGTGSDAAAASMAVVRGASGAQALQDAGVDGRGVGVALVDSGVVPVAGLDGDQVVRGPDFSSEANDPDLAGLDTFGHGTHVAGIIAGDDGSGFTGVAPGAHVVSVKVAGADGSTSLLQVLAGLDWVRRHAGDPGLDIRVVNLSLGVAPGKAGYVADPLAYAVEQLWKSGLVVVAAAGNDGPASTQLDLPAADPYVIAVGADDTNGTAATDDDSVASFSERGRLRSPDVVAPGTAVVSLRDPGSTLDRAFPAARIGTNFFRGSGTSQATAVVSGLAALLLQQRPDLAPDQVKALLTAGASPIAADGPGSSPAKPAEGAGLVDAAASAALDTPDLASVAQDWPDAVLDPHALKNRGVGQQGDRWAGRRWSGRSWSGRSWSGRSWSGRSWSSAGWDGDGSPDSP